LRGITFIELVVVIAIFGILLAIAGIQYHEWQTRYGIETQVRQLYMDLMGARVEAMQQNQVYIVRFNASAYIVYRDENGNNTYDSGIDTRIDRFSKIELKYPIKLDSDNNNTLDIVINRRGIFNQNLSLRVTKQDGTLSGAEYDCLNITQIRINLGKYNGTTCENK
jgi:prepilin-type N-terminal cleavage/methylation domain-containing protein